MSGPAGGRIACRRPCADGQLGVAAWVLAGRPEQVAGVRRWAQAVAAAWGAAAADTGLVVSELVTNAILHTRSGRPGGTVIVAVAGGWEGVIVHVHDQGTASGQMPRRRPAGAGRDGLAEGGRGLPIVIAVSAEWGTLPQLPGATCGDPAIRPPRSAGAAPGAACLSRPAGQMGRRARMADGEVFMAELYARHYGPLMRLAVRLTGDRQHAEDLAQEAMARAWQHREAIMPGRERAWLAATARNLAIDCYRREQRRQALEAWCAFLTVAGDDLAGRVADMVTVRAAVAALPPGRRAVIAELYYAGRTVAETAVVLGVPPGTVKSRASYALAALRSALTADPCADGAVPGGKATR